MRRVQVREAISTSPSSRPSASRVRATSSTTTRDAPPPGEDESSYAAAEKRLLRAVTVLRGEGLKVHDQIAHPDPYAAVMQTLDDERVDEIIVSTLPNARSG